MTMARRWPNLDSRTRRPPASLIANRLHLLDHDGVG
jgi:hypothetical protein